MTPTLLSLDNKSLYVVTIFEVLENELGLAGFSTKQNNTDQG